MLSRPWAADPFLTAVSYQFVRKANSICKMLTFKPFVQDMYVAARKTCSESVQISPKIRDFAYAPQRYSSEAKSLTRMVLTFDAVCLTLNQVILARGPSSTEGQASAETLTFLTDEVALQLAMLADVALQLDSTVHACDQDLHDSLPQRLLPSLSHWGGSKLADCQI